MKEFENLNSLTKYPSIPTYHKMGDRGILLNEYVDFRGEHVSITEKIDGTNARIIFFDGGYIIGSREDLLHYAGDRIWNPTLGIVDALKPIADRVLDKLGSYATLTVVYGELFGGKIGANAKQYTSKGETAFRVFDVVAMTKDQVDPIIAKDRKDISIWRENGGQKFLNIYELADLCKFCNLETVPAKEVDKPPTDRYEIFNWLKEVAPHTEAKLDDEAGGKAEGVVIRSHDRSKIAKIRFDDYRKLK